MKKLKDRARKLPKNCILNESKIHYKHISSGNFFGELRYCPVCNKKHLIIKLK